MHAPLDYKGYWSQKCLKYILLMSFNVLLTNSFTHYEGFYLMKLVVIDESQSLLKWTCIVMS